MLLGFLTPLINIEAKSVAEGPKSNLQAFVKVRVFPDDEYETFCKIPSAPPISM